MRQPRLFGGRRLEAHVPGEELAQPHAGGGMGKEHRDTGPVVLQAGAERRQCPPAVHDRQGGSQEDQPRGRDRQPPAPANRGQPRGEPHAAGQADQRRPAAAEQERAAQGEAAGEGQDGTAQGRRPETLPRPPQQEQYHGAGQDQMGRQAVRIDERAGGPPLGQAHPHLLRDHGALFAGGPFGEGQDLVIAAANHLVPRAERGQQAAGRHRRQHPPAQAGRPPQQDPGSRRQAEQAQQMPDKQEGVVPFRRADQAWQGAPEESQPDPPAAQPFPPGRPLPATDDGQQQQPAGKHREQRGRPGGQNPLQPGDREKGNLADVQHRAELQRQEEDEGHQRPPRQS
ncbi:MAG: hypothetical protein BWZ02_03312 [Lentisphaerae bacterium ADurb.BinA184]|nr:MAG: hypothetical protein BWZ02_03312 [Lentisphaerae bacterium ADurb.BinA184]